MDVLDVFAIVNPLAGAGANPDIAATRVALLNRRFQAAGVNGGMGPYVRIGVVEIFRYRAGTYRVTLDGEEIVSNALVIAFANGREYGNRIRVAPQALVDDGKLEAVVVEDRGPFARLWTGR